MTAAIVYESSFGNTEDLAGHVARGLEDEGLEVVVRRAGDPLARDLTGRDLLVLAAPTHALTLSTPASRAKARQQGAAPAPGPGDDAGGDTGGGLREWLAAQTDAGGVLPPTAVFDTRAAVARHWPGSAARHTVRVLRRRGVVVLGRTSFYVDGVRGPVVGGEPERARAWGRDVARAARAATRAPGAGAGV